MLYFLQIENASNKLIDYGILGVVLIFVGFFAYKMYNKINEDQKIWRDEAIQSRKELINLSIKQNELNNKLIDIRQKDVDQNEKNFYDIRKQLDNMPESLRKELKAEFPEIACNFTNKTSAG